MGIAILVEVVVAATVAVAAVEIAGQVAAAVVEVTAGAAVEVVLEMVFVINQLYIS